MTNFVALTIDVALNEVVASRCAAEDSFRRAPAKLRSTSLHGRLQRRYTSFIRRVLGALADVLHSHAPGAVWQHVLAHACASNDKRDNQNPAHVAPPSHASAFHTPEFT